MSLLLSSFIPVWNEALTNMQGPGATWSSGTLLPSIETTVEYAVQMMKKIQHENIRSMAVKQEALDDIYAHFDEFHKTTVWQEDCRSWFKDGQIKNRIYLWPGPVSSCSPLVLIFSPFPSSSLHLPFSLLNIS